MPLQATSGAASYDAFGGGVPVEPNYIESVFSCFLYTGNGSTQTITNGIDLAGEGGLVWVKARSDVDSHYLFDTAQGANYKLTSNNTNAASTGWSSYFSFGSTGFSLIGGSPGPNYSPYTYASWTFRKQPKFFDVVTYTGNGAGFGGSNVVNHNLASLPGCVIIKNVTDVSQWFVFTRNSSGTYYQLNLNQTAAGAGPYDATTYELTSTSFNAAKFKDLGSVNTDGNTYVAYLFAHNAGGFGLTGTDNVISCGSGTVGTEVNLGYEPQFVIMKRTTLAGQWYMLDNMRGWNVSGDDQYVSASSSGAESAGDYGYPTATGFYPTGFGSTGNDFIYIAIRRGPMKVPTSGTSVFSPVARTGTGLQTNVSGLSFSPDLLLVKNRGNTQLNWAFDKLRGGNQPLSSNSTDDEATNISNYFGGSTVFTPNNTGFGISNAAQVNTTSGSYANWLFGRAPSFFDEVCYTGTGSGQVINHNLGVTPELMIFKARNNLNNSGYEYWYTNAPNTTYALALNSNVGESYTKISSANSTTISLGSSNNYVLTGQTYVAYLFATCAGVSKVGSYTGNGSSQTINCGFTGGARFVLIKRTDSTGDWYVYDTARGMTTLTDPYLLLNSTAAESATLGSVTTVSTGFAMNAGILAAINTNGASYIFLAIA